MNASDLPDETLFEGALNCRTPAELAAYLDQACAGQPELRRKLEALLEANDQAGIFLEPALAARPTIKLDLADAPDEAVGQTLGRYKLLEHVGEGGCGVVYVAEQTEPVRRRVALKVIKLGMDTKQVVARFEAERQALAMMDHPNIAKVLDAGTTDVGRPYFVMEPVRGIKITDYCDQANLSTEERLNLFIKVCQAIQHAHQKGIIHRDIKPSNILVTLHDGVPVPKVIDFGIAKVTEGRLTDATVYTQLHQFIGTPAYMSPEQAAMSGLDIDTRSDIYSLGVLLYELLAGSPPFDAKELMASGIDAMHKTIREKEPVRPSTRLATLKGDDLTTTAERRSVDAPRLIHQLQGDLDWIVMKALEKDRTRRFDTANSFAQDIRRHLGNEAVLACPPSAAYLFQKLVRRHKLAFAAGAAVVVTLFAGIVMTTWQAVRATRAEKSANNQRDRADGEAKRASRLLYVAHMNLVQAAWESTRLGPVLDLLRQHEPQPGEEDLRGFEWHYWDRLSHSFLLDLEGHAKPVRSVVFSPDGKRLASAGGGLVGRGEVKVWDATSGQEIFALKGHTAPVNCVAFSPDGKWLASASGYQLFTDMPGEVKVWDATTGKVLLTLPGPKQGVASVAFSPDGKRLVSASDGFALPVLSPDGKRVVSANGPFELKVWDVTTGEVLQILKAHGSGILSVAFSPDGTRLASSSEDQTVTVWDATNGQEVLTLKGHTDKVRSVAFSADGKTLASASEDQTVKIWDATTGLETRALKGHAGSVSGVAFSPDGLRLASGSDDRTVKVWDTANYPEPLTWHAGSITSVAFGPDGKRVASAGNEYDRFGVHRDVKVWDAASGQELLILKGHTDTIMSVAFSLDGKRLASAGSGLFELGEVKVWDATSGQETLQLKGHSGEVWSVTFSITMLSIIVDFRLKFCPAAGAATDQPDQPRLDRVQHLLPRSTRSFFWSADK